MDQISAYRLIIPNKYPDLVFEEYRNPWSCCYREQLCRLPKRSRALSHVLRGKENRAAKPIRARKLLGRQKSEITRECQWLDKRRKASRRLRQSLSKSFRQHSMAAGPTVCNTQLMRKMVFLPLTRFEKYYWPLGIMAGSWIQLNPAGVSPIDFGVNRLSRQTATPKLSEEVMSHSAESYFQKKENQVWLGRSWRLLQQRADLLKMKSSPKKAKT